ncbi:hypothetical protein GALL_488550 [mine drainage metagenome]|uniref:Uncharacterized protein n=1 Tax=mine drainage metagenome TaxID=410659 RepID=A0A1J5PDW5_9ZZZZ
MHLRQFTGKRHAVLAQAQGLAQLGAQLDVEQVNVAAPRPQTFHLIFQQLVVFAALGQFNTAFGEFVLQFHLAPGICRTALRTALLLGMQLFAVGHLQQAQAQTQLVVAPGIFLALVLLGLLAFDVGFKLRNAVTTALGNDQSQRTLLALLLALAL